MSMDDPQNDPIVSVEFEVYGKVQGCYFPKYVRDISRQLGLGGWVKNTPRGTILGMMQGPESMVQQMAQWLTTVGSPGSEIHHVEFTNREYITRMYYKGFNMRF